MDKVFNILAKTNGLLGVYANAGFGKTTFMLQVVEEINRRKNGTAIIFELEEVKGHAPILESKLFINMLKRSKEKMLNVLEDTNGEYSLYGQKYTKK